MKRIRRRDEEREAAFLRDIVIEAKDVQDFTKGLNLPTFVADRMARKAVVKSIESIAEATKHLTPALKERHPIIAWKQIAGFRDFSTHHYWELDYGIVWDVVKQHLPPLLAVAKEELRLHRAARK
jgi:uncharacterized protein with HEPN domain